MEHQRLTDEQIEAMYAPSDYSKDKRLALAQFGFGLMAPTRGGKIGTLNQSGGTTVWAQNLSKNKTTSTSGEQRESTWHAYR